MSDTSLPNEYKIEVTREIEKEKNLQSDLVKNVKVGIGNIINIIKIVHDYGEETQLEQLRICLKEHIHQLFLLDQYNESLDEIKEAIKQSAFLSNVIDDLHMIMENSTMNDAEIEKHKDYIRFMEAAGLIRHDDDYIECTENESTFSTKCPISQIEMKDPMKSTLCGHTYSKEGIHHLLRKKGSVKCPLGGCQQIVKMSDLERDTDMEIRLDRLNRTAKFQSQFSKETCSHETVDDESEEEYVIQ